MAVLSTSANIATPGLPVGSIQAFAGANAPTGWLLCDGSAVSRGNYPDLYNTIGNTYGSGDGSTTFNLPDLRGRMPIGAGNDGTAANNASRTRGDKGGDTRMQSHNHGGTTGNDSPDHAHGPGAGLAFLTTSGGAASNFGSQIAAAQHTPGQTAGANARHAHSISTSGSGGAENMPPFLVTNYIIKAVADIARGGWYTQSSPPVVTQLPVSASFGDEVIYVADATNGIYWHLRYDGQGTYPWKFVGGSDLILTSGGSGNTTVSANTYTTPTSASTLTLPLAGDYDVTAQANIEYASSGVVVCWYGYQVGSTGAVDADSAKLTSPTQYSGGSFAKTNRKTGLAASTVLTPKVKANTGATVYVENTRLIARPIRVKAT